MKTQDLLTIHKKRYGLRGYSPQQLESFLQQLRKAQLKISGDCIRYTSHVIKAKDDIARYEDAIVSIEREIEGRKNSK